MNGGVEIGQLELGGRLAQPRLPEGKQQPESIAVGSDVCGLALRCCMRRWVKKRSMSGARVAAPVMTRPPACF